MAENAILKLSKMDVARRQLETAVRLYFVLGDPVSLHTLVAAAYQVIRDVNRAQAGDPMLKDIIPNWVHEDYRDKAKQKINEAENFFKHADRDHQEILEFKQELTELLLFEACNMYGRLSGEVIPALAVYQAWYYIGPGIMFKFSPEIEESRRNLRRLYPNATRQSFFREVLPMAMNELSKSR